MRDPRSRSGADNADRPPPGQVDVGAANMLKLAGSHHCDRISPAQQVATAWPIIASRPPKLPSMWPDSSFSVIIRTPSTKPYAPLESRSATPLAGPAHSPHALISYP